MNSVSIPDPETRFADLVRHSHDAIFEHSAEGLIVSWNPAAERLYGLSAAEAVGGSIDVVVPAGRESFQKACTRSARAGGDVDAVETTRVGPGGRQLHVTVSMRPGSEIGAVVDVSSPSMAEMVRVRSEGHFRDLLDAAPDAMVCVDARGVITLVNQQVSNLFQYSAAEIVGQPVEVLLPLEMVDGHAAQRDDYLLDPRKRSMGAGTQLMGRRRDRSTFPADLTLSTMDGDDGTIVTVAVRDVSERLLAGLALQESERRFQQLASSVPAAFTLRGVDPPVLLYASPGFQSVFGYDIAAENDGDLGPFGVLGHVFEDDQDRIHEISDHMVEDGGHAETDYRIVRSDGEVRWIHTTKAPVYDTAGVLTRIASLSEDITKRKLAEAELRTAHRDAERANAAKDQFLSRVSHELRTPMNSVLGFAQLLELDPLTQPQHESVSRILRAGRHLLTMIDDVLDIARIDSNELNIAPEPTMIAQVITETVGILRPMADAALVDMRYPTLAADVDYSVLADPRRLSQIMLNLLSNAVKYNRRGGHVEIRCSIRDQVTLLVAVRDTGIGIRTEDLPRLFEPFDRVGAESLGIEGVGIGLAISRRLAQAMGARLTIESTIGKGSTFTVAIPLAHSTVSANTTKAAAQFAPPPIVPPTEPGQLTVVYIEDNADNIDLMRRILARRPGWRMMHAETGALGLEVTRWAPPALILLDLHLPDTTGAEILQDIRSSADLSEVPVIIVTADASPTQVAHLRALGATDYLTKPLDVNRILQILDRIAASINEVR